MGRRKEEMAWCCIKNSTRSIRELRTGGGVHERRGNGYNLCLEFVGSFMS